MNKGLEAFKYIKNNIHYFEPVCQEDEDKIKEVDDIIIKELKILQMLRRNVRLYNSKIRDPYFVFDDEGLWIPKIKEIDVVTIEATGFVLKNSEEEKIVKEWLEEDDETKTN